MSAAPAHTGFHGPLCWALTAGAGALLGAVLAWLVPGVYAGSHPSVPLWLVAPFGALLLSIALMPFISARFWHAHFPDFAFFLGGFVGAYYLRAFRAPGEHSNGLPYGSAEVLHAATEYYAFIALVGGLYVISGGVLIEVRARGTPLANTLLLGAGAVLANLVGTTGASMLLIRPFMRMNRGRLRPFHVVMFIFIVSNCGGCLTPIGDPPLYLGFLKGVPFFWTVRHLWPHWVLVIGCLLAAFYVIDRWRLPPTPGDPPAERRGPVRIRGAWGLAGLMLMLATVILGPRIAPHLPLGGLPGVPTLLLILAVAAHRLAPRDILAANEFTFFPVKEVGLLFLGIFLTMTPALGYLAEHGDELGITTPGAFYFATGSLSALLDNAPTYANFLQVAFADPAFNPLAPENTAITPQTVGAFLYESPGVDRAPSAAVLEAVSAAAVFFGAMTYIGNGPNFMVKAIAEDAGVDMPSFFGYLVLAAAILLPILLLNWATFVR